MPDSHRNRNGSRRRLIRALAFLLGAALAVPPSVSAAADGPAWGFGFRFGTFGVPDLILDQFLEEHPQVEGSLAGLELRYYGEGGPEGSFSLGLAVDHGSAQASGTWKRDAWDEAARARGEVTLIATTLTAYWDIFASSPVHPYIGLGLGYARMHVHYREEDRSADFTEDLPALHIPLGLVIRLGPHVGLGAEARFINGFSYGGRLTIDF